MALYDELVAAGCRIDNHESDLYVEATPEAERILRASDRWSTVKSFISQVDGKRWFDVPFAYVPFWEAKQSGR